MACNQIRKEFADRTGPSLFHLLRAIVVCLGTPITGIPLDHHADKEMSLQSGLLSEAKAANYESVGGRLGRPILATG